MAAVYGVGKRVLVGKKGLKIEIVSTYRGSQKSVYAPLSNTTSTKTSRILQ